MIKLSIEVPNDFLKEEKLCDYLVSKEMKEIWAVEIDLLSMLDKICEKYNLRYAAAYGTLLGTIRHNGFIPWDDDIDVVMPRDDYEKLIKISQKEFSFPYFLECYETDNRYISGFAKLKNSNTTAIENPKSGRNQGMFIDIFPLDHVIDDKKKLKSQGKKIKFWNFLLFLIWFSTEENQAMSSFPKHKQLIGTFLKSLFHIFNITPHSKIVKYCMKRQKKECSKYNNVQTQYMTTLSCSNAFMTLNKVDDFNHLLKHDFEFTHIPIEPGFEEVLTKRFGDYHQFVKGGSSHDIILFDTNKSYKEHIRSSINQ